MWNYCCLYLLVLLLGQVEGEVRLQIYNKQYVKVCCGEPCEWLTFQVNRTLSAIYIHNSKFVSQSRTYFRSSDGLSDSEYFYLDDQRIRFPVSLVSMSASLVTKDTLAADGTLGLGDYSPLWTEWDNYTLSSKRLTLGGYDFYAQFEHSERPPVINLNQHNWVTLGDNSLVEIDFSLNSVETYVPYPLDMEKALNSVTLQSEDCMQDYSTLYLAGGVNVTGKHKKIACKNSNTLKPNKRQDLELFNGADYQAVKYTSSQKFIPGARFFSEFFTFRNIVTQQLIITNDAYSMDYREVTNWAALFITLSLGFWCQIAISKKERKDNFEFFFTQITEATCYIIDFMVLYVTFGMLNWDRYISHYTFSNPVFARIFILTAPAVTLTYWIYGLYTAYDYQAYSKRFKKTGMFHAVLFVTSQLVMVWLCFIRDHESLFERVAGAFILNIALIYQIVATLWFYMSRDFVYGSICLAIVVVSNVFNIMYTVRPMFDNAGFKKRFSSYCVIWVYFLEILPAMLIFFSAYSYKTYMKTQEQEPTTSEPAKKK